MAFKINRICHHLMSPWLDFDARNVFRSFHIISLLIDTCLPAIFKHLVPGLSFSLLFAFSDSERQRAWVRFHWPLCSPESGSPLFAFIGLQYSAAPRPLGYKMQTVSKSARCLKTPVFIFEPLFFTLFASKTNKDKVCGASFSTKSNRICPICLWKKKKKHDNFMFNIII